MSKKEIDNGYIFWKDVHDEFYRKHEMPSMSCRYSAFEWDEYCKNNMSFNIIRVCNNTETYHSRYPIVMYKIRKIKYAICKNGDIYP